MTVPKTLEDLRRTWGYNCLFGWNIERDRKGHIWWYEVSAECWEWDEEDKRVTKIRYAVAERVPFDLENRRAFRQGLIADLDAELEEHFGGKK